MSDALVQCRGGFGCIVVGLDRGSRAYAGAARDGVQRSALCGARRRRDVVRARVLELCGGCIASLLEEAAYVHPRRPRSLALAMVARGCCLGAHHGRGDLVDVAASLSAARAGAMAPGFGARSHEAEEGGGPHACLLAHLRCIARRPDPQAQQGSRPQAITVEVWRRLPRWHRGEWLGVVVRHVLARDRARHLLLAPQEALPAQVQADDPVARHPLHSRGGGRAHLTVDRGLSRRRLRPSSQELLSLRARLRQEVRLRPHARLGAEIGQGWCHGGRRHAARRQPEAHQHRGDAGGAGRAGLALRARALARPPAPLDRAGWTSTRQEIVQWCEQVA
mmetsp:Transcript_66176/g.190957  ORF Transcript_66176/g.190957 Transcript_66176/m.190957 type:complete len:335 (-) Transcript_66176:151-1155(-)